MRVEHTPRGFEILLHATYPPPGQGTNEERLAQQSSVIRDYPDARDRPGSSALWVGDRHHLSRTEVQELVNYLKRWLETGHLEPVVPLSAPTGPDLEKQEGG